MALKVLMLRKKAQEKRTELEQLRSAAQGFARREEEIAQAIEEASTQEEKTTVEEEVDAFEREKGENASSQTALEQEIQEIEKQIGELEAAAPKGTPDPGAKRKENKPMETREKFFGMTAQQRDAFFARQDVKEFLQRARELGAEKRAVNGSELLIPTVMLELVRENIAGYSKLLAKVNARQVPGKARQNIMGTIPEAVWTETCAVLNELTIGFNSVEVDGYKVGGYIAVCDAILQDSDVALAREIISALGQAIGYALDKAILYGTGSKMPLGIVTRLAQETKPGEYPASAREWQDLHISNLISLTGKTDLELFKGLLTASGAAKGKYSRGKKFWAMSETTRTTLMAHAMSINAAGAIVSGQDMTLPVIGGEIVELDFIPDGDIIGGYGDLYLLAERAGTAIAQSSHVRFLEDQTVFKGTARYDGQPVIPEGFVAVNIAGKGVTTSLTFASDEANKGKAKTPAR